VVGVRPDAWIGSLDTGNRETVRSSELGGGGRPAPSELSGRTERAGKSPTGVVVRHRHRQMVPRWSKVSHIWAGVMVAVTSTVSIAIPELR